MRMKVSRIILIIVVVAIALVARCQDYPIETSEQTAFVDSWSVEPSEGASDFTHN